MRTASDPGSDPMTGVDLGSGDAIQEKDL
jgi:hypothetical protein